MAECEYQFVTHTDYMENGSAIEQFGLNNYFPNYIHVCEQANSDFLPHRHPNIEVKYIYDGELDILLNGEIIPVSKGDFVIANSNELHGYHITGNIKYCTLIFDIGYINEIMSSDHGLIFRSVIHNDEQIGKIMNTLIDEFFTRPLMYGQNADALFRQLLIHLIRNYLVNEMQFSPVKAKRGNVSATVIDFLTHNFNKKLTIDNIANSVGFNRHYMMRAFKRETGVTIAKQLYFIRTHYAANLLKNTVKPLSEIAFLSGFESTSHFNRTFRQYSGMPPLRYRLKDRHETIKAKD